MNTPKKTIAKEQIVATSLIEGNSLIDNNSENKRGRIKFNYIMYPGLIREFQYAPVLTPNQIIKACADYFNVKMDDIKSNSRKEDIARARHFAMFLIREFIRPKLSFMAIGIHIGGFDHATVMHACKSIINLSDTQVKYRTYLSDLRNILFI